MMITLNDVRYYEESHVREMMRRAVLLHDPELDISQNEVDRVLKDFTPDMRKIAQGMVLVAPTL